MNVKWIKCLGDTWCPFISVNLSGITTAGIYVIWKSGKNNKVVRVGQGVIADRIADHRKDQKITRHGDMLVTWASVSQQYRDGIERYLADKYSPLEGDRYPDAVPIAVNLLGE